jgi:hypothetical protein
MKNPAAVKLGKMANGAKKMMTPAAILARQHNLVVARSKRWQKRKSK